jgi:DNA-binding NarL/FixJ family response regulator
MTPLRKAAPAPRIRTLIADDEPLARHGVRLLLEKEDGIDIVGEASGGVEAADLIQRLRPDLVFLDVQMVGCDGFETLKRVGRRPRRWWCLSRPTTSTRSRPLSSTRSTTS